ncbi:MAG: rhodanese-like domain-containing protein, partial [Candidatus Peregrinibacteria bacterium]|nr:rhodanese-like domain-containing protein [Candidatus Peregrinibacteria bacterium]
VTELQPGESGILTVEFDPNLHEEPEGKFFKTVTLLTEPALEERVDVAVWVEIDLDLGPEAFKLQGPHADEAPHDEVPHDDEGKHENGRAYHDLDAEQLKAMLADKDFFLLDVHIPEQTHIPGTDAFVDYRKLAENADQLPEDKDTQIVVYCRSGGMSLQASSELSAMGYTEVYNLLGGINAFNAL